jgi:predicted nucleotidyltransferase
MLNIIFKGRNRQVRGKLTDINELSENVKNNFILIKLFLNEYLSKEVDVYIFGSYYWGYYNEKSDYDVIINEEFDKKDLREKLRSTFKFKVDVIKNELKTIKI